MMSTTVSSTDPMGMDVSAAPLPRSTIPGAVLLYQLARTQRQDDMPPVPVLPVRPAPEASQSAIPDDGYRWRKYGRKIVGGQVRHYYRCTSPGCECKRQVTWEEEEAVVVQVGSHNHTEDGKRAFEEDDDGLSGSLASKRGKRLPPRPAKAIPFTKNLKEFVSLNRKDTFKVRVGRSVAAANDGYVWLLENDYQRCAHSGCDATRVIVDDVLLDECTVTYHGLHNHVAPIGALQKEEEVSSSSGSASRSNALQDIYDALKEEISSDERGGERRT